MHSCYVMKLSAAVKCFLYGMNFFSWLVVLGFNATINS